MWFKKRKPRSKFYPESGERYWYITDRLSVDYDFMEQYVGQARQRVGNVFRVRREAESFRNELKSIL